MNWSQEKTVEFIEEYRKLVALWDVRLEKYKNNQAKLDAQRRLAKKFDCDVAVVKKKIKNLRTAFHREHRNRTQKKSGSSNKRSKWFAYDLLLFLLDVEKPRPGYTSQTEAQAEQPIFDEANPEEKFDDVPRESLQAPEDRSSSDLSHNNSDEVPIPVSPEQFLSEHNEQEDATTVPPTPIQQKPESYQLRHNNHLTIVLEALARDESFMDVTLTAQGRSLKAHKSVLSAVSSYFRGVLRDNPCQHPIIIMPRDVRFEELYSIVNYIYKGEMTVAAEDLTSLLKTAEILQVSGLAPSDSTATVNPHTESLTPGNVRSSSTSSSASSSNIPPVSRTSRVPKSSSQSITTPPARPRSIDSMINPADFIDIDMTCVKEEVLSGGEDDDKDEQGNKESCSQPSGSQSTEISQTSGCSQPSDSQPAGCSQPTGDDTKEDEASDQVILSFPTPFDQNPEHNPIPSTSSQEVDFRSLGIKSDPEPDLNSQRTKTTDSPKPLLCPHCEEQYRDMDSIISHLRIKHPTKPSFTCKCGRIFTRQIHHQAHTRMCSYS